jgi:hypothetical protein
VTRRGLLLVAVAAAVFVALVVWVLLPPSEQPYFDYVAKLRAEGVAVDYDGLRGKDVPPEENGAADLLAACDWLDANAPEREWTAPGPWKADFNPDWRDHATPEQIEDLAKLADRLAPFLALMEKAASKPHIQFADRPRDAYGFADDGHIPKLQRTHRVLVALMSGARDPARRIDAMVCVATLARRIDTVSSIDRMVAGAYSASAVFQVRTGLENGLLDPSAARSRLDPFFREEWLAQTPRIVRSERVLLIQTYRAILDGTIKVERGPWYERLLGRMFGRESRALDAGMAREAVAMCENLRAAEALPVGHYTEYAKAMSQFTREDHVSSEASTIVVPAALKHFARHDAERRLARIALAAAEYRATHGDFPASLDELKPMFPDGVPLDPFGDTPFVYTKTATGVGIESAGRLAADAPIDEATLRERCLVWELKR